MVWVMVKYFNLKRKNIIMIGEKGAGIVWYVIALLLGIAVIGVLGYWFFAMGGRLGVISQYECSLRANSACEEWKAAGFPSTMDAKVFCKNGEPAACCSGLDDGWHEIKKLKVEDRTWWNCIAPGCYDLYGIEVTKKEHCGVPG